MSAANLYASLPEALPEELVEVLLRRPELRLERIVSRGHVTPSGEWYDQDWDEWVLLLRGAARLRVEGQDGEIRLGPGDYLFLRAHLRHRVTWTAEEEETVWLALHLAPVAIGT